MSNDVCLSDADAAFLRGGVTIALAACGSDGRMAIGRGLAVMVADEGRRITLIVPRESCLAVLDAIRASGHVAAVFTRPTTHRSIQFKGADARVDPCETEDTALVQRYVRTLAMEVRELGFDAPFVDAYTAHDPTTLARVTFHPTDAFDQTPGPQAGERLGT